MQDPQSQWVNNFWGQNDSGYHQLMQRMHDSRQTLDELKQFYKERIHIEQEYTAKLNHLARRALGTAESGDMRLALETVRSTTQNASLTHETVARQINEQLLNPLQAFSTSIKARSKTIEDTMAQLTKAKTSQNQSSEKARNKYVAECNKISGYQASQNLLMGKELDRNNQKLDKATYQVEGLQRQYQDSLKALAQTMESWNDEWRVSIEKLQNLEEERLGFMKSNLWAYANSLSAACVADDEACETVRLALERCEPIQDLEKFSKDNGTGSLIQDPPEFVNFLQGFSREADEDNHYHVASFNANTIPDLGVPSPSSSLQPSPTQSQNAFTPLSSMNTSPVLDHYQMEKSKNVESFKQSAPPTPLAPSAPASPVKKRKSWAMPFKKKQVSIDIPQSYVSALDEPQQRSFDVVSAPKVTPKSEHRKSWAPSSQTQDASNAYASINSSSESNEDPLLTALEKLKAPGLKARPKSAYAPMATASPYNTPVSEQSGHQASKSIDLSGRRSPQRKQVPNQFPMMTSDGRKVIKHSRANYDYRAAIPEEVTFRKGDLLLITEMQDDGWWDCEVANQGVFGLAPSNFLVDA